MARTITSIARPRAWWVDVLASVFALGVAQAVVFGVITVMDSGRADANLDGTDTVAVFGTTIDSSGLSKLPPLSIELQGEVSGLFPGAVADLALAMTNPTDLDIVVDTVDVTVGPPDIPGCPTEALLIGPSRTAGFGSIPANAVIGPEETARVTVQLALAQDAPSQCQGAVFPLTYRSAGWLA